MKYYVPNFTNSSCVVVRDTNTLRVYEHQPTTNSTVNFVDYYIHSNYYSTTGSSTFSQYTTLPQCVDRSLLTRDFYYRIDFPSIMLTALAMIFVGFFLVRNLIRTLFVDWRYS